MNLPDFLEMDDDGEIRLRRHRIRLIEVARRYDEGHSVETIILDHHPTLTLPLVHKTVAFYLENQAAVQAPIAQHEQEMQRLAALPQTTPTLAELRRRMQVKSREAP